MTVRLLVWAALVILLFASRATAQVTTFENVGNANTGSAQDQFKYLVGNRADGGVRLSTKPQPGSGEMWKLSNTPQSGQVDPSCHLASTSCYGVLEWCHYECVLPQYNSTSFCGACIGINFK
jgi:hypothetical protein